MAGRKRDSIEELKCTTFKDFGDLRGFISGFPKEFLKNYKRENGDCHFKFEGYVLLVVNVDWSEVTEYLDDNGGFYRSQFDDMKRFYYTF